MASIESDMPYSGLSDLQPAVWSFLTAVGVSRFGGKQQKRKQPAEAEECEKPSGHILPNVLPNVNGDSPGPLLFLQRLLHESDIGHILEQDSLAAVKKVE